VPRRAAFQTAGLRRGRRAPWLHQVSGKGQEVRSHDRGTHVTRKASRASPGAAFQTEATLQERDPAFDGGTEVPEPPVDPLALGHVEHFQAPLLRETHVPDPRGLGVPQIGLGGVAAIEGRLPWDLAIDLLLPLDHASGECGVRRVAVLDHPIQDESGASLVRVSSRPYNVSRRSLTMMSVCSSKIETSFSPAGTCSPCSTRRPVWSITRSARATWPATPGPSANRGAAPGTPLQEMSDESLGSEACKWRDRCRVVDHAEPCGADALFVRNRTITPPQDPASPSGQTTRYRTTYCTSIESRALAQTVSPRMTMFGGR
jgi:hypothetical protein